MRLCENAQVNCEKFAPLCSRPSASSFRALVLQGPRSDLLIAALGMRLAMSITRTPILIEAVVCGNVSHRFPRGPFDGLITTGLRRDGKEGTLW